MKPHYRFVSRWKFDAPLEAVWSAIYASEEWPLWWRYVKQVEEDVKGDERGIGSIRHYVFSSPTGYRLRFRLRLEERVDLKLLRGSVSGDLKGGGSWRFYEEGGRSVAECYWEVSTHVPWMNRLSFLLRPLFRLNHRVVMRAGELALRKKLIKSTGSEAAL